MYPKEWDYRITRYTYIDYKGFYYMVEVRYRNSWCLVSGRYLTLGFGDHFSTKWGARRAAKKAIKLQKWKDAIQEDQIVEYGNLGGKN